jgi:hypothetical protein
MYSCLADFLERLLLDDPTEAIDGMPPRRQSPPVPISSAEPASLTPTSTAWASSAPSQEEGAAVTHAQLRQYHESQINPNLTSVHNQFRQFTDQSYELVGRLNSQAQDIQGITSQYSFPLKLDRITRRQPTSWRKCALRFPLLVWISTTSNGCSSSRGSTLPT